MKRIHTLAVASLAAALASPARFGDGGLLNASDGIVANERRLLEEAVDTLSIYNANANTFADQFCSEVIEERNRMLQTPFEMKNAAEGSRPEDQSPFYRLTLNPFLPYEVGTEFTIDWLEDSTVQDFRDVMNAAMVSDAALKDLLFFKAMFLKQTAGSIATPYMPSFYNGETDVPWFENEDFTGVAHYHYLGTNATALTKTIWTETKNDILEHGFGRPDTGGRLEAVFNIQDAGLLQPLYNDGGTALLQAITSIRARAIDDGILDDSLMIDGVRVRLKGTVPQGYFAMYDPTRKFMNRRVHRKPENRGLKLFQKGNASDPNHPISGMVLRRRVGYVPRLLGAVTVRQVVGSTTYTNPTFRAPAKAPQDA